MSAIVLIRHLETDLAGKFCGHSDPDLNAVGQRRLQSLAERLAPLGIARIVSSDLRRASRTALAIGERIGVPVETRPGLREIHFGLWEGLLWEEIEQGYHDEARLWVSEFPMRSAPGGEPYREFVARVEAEFMTLIADSRGAMTAAVTHRGVMQHALTRFFGFSERDARKGSEDYGAIVVVSQSSPAEIDSAVTRA